jgi:hypothetical protein
VENEAAPRMKKRLEQACLLLKSLLVEMEGSPKTKQCRVNGLKANPHDDPMPLFLRTQRLTNKLA